MRGDLEVKSIYVECLPDLPVHAVEVRNYKWSQDLSIIGARKGMDADASVIVGFVDYDIGEHFRAYKHKYYGSMSSDDDECTGSSATEPYAECDQEIDVAIVLKITAKVMTDRQVSLCCLNHLSRLCLKAEPVALNGFWKRFLQKSPKNSQKGEEY